MRHAARSLDGAAGGFESADARRLQGPCAAFPCPLRLAKQMDDVGEPSAEIAGRCKPRIRLRAPAVAKRLPSTATVLAHRRLDARAKTYILRNLLSVRDRAWPRTGGFESRWGYQKLLTG